MRIVHDRRGLDDGFTLIELMIVVLILGILVGIAVASFAQATGSARSAACLSNQRSIHSVLEEYYMQNGKYPESLDEISSLSDADKRCPSDKKPYDYPVSGNPGFVSCPNHD